MNRWIIDTNVPIAANIPVESDAPRGAVSEWCVEQAVCFLNGLSSKDCVLLDSGDEIMEEYSRHLKYSEQPGPGDRFFQQLQSCLIPSNFIDLPIDAEGEYNDLPDEIAKSTFDKSDRKFAAIAAKENAPVVNATDSDWLHHKKILRQMAYASSSCADAIPKSGTTAVSLMRTRAQK